MSRATHGKVEVGALYMELTEARSAERGGVAAEYLLNERSGVAAAGAAAEYFLSPASLEKARAGDPVELQMLTRRELPRVEGLLRRLLGHRSDMEDLVQTVFLEMCRALPGFRGESTFSTFVGGITVRVARRAMRPSAWVRFRAPMPEVPPASSDRPDANAFATEQLRRLQEALTRIAADKRISFVLWAVEGMDVDAIAEMTGASVAATRSRIYYAQKELRSLAANDPYLRELVEDDHAR